MKYLKDGVTESKTKDDKDHGEVATALLQNEAFLEACRKLNVPPKRRQANKFLRKQGIVFQYMKQGNVVEEV